MAENRAIVPSTSAPITQPPDPKRSRSGFKVSTTWLQFLQRLSKLANAALAAVSVAVAGALDGDGTPASPLSVRVDGTTINKVGNNLHAINQGINQLTGDVTAGPGTGSQVATIAANAVTYAKLQAVSAASRLLGRGTAGGAVVREIAVDATLAFTGNTLGVVASVVGRLLSVTVTLDDTQTKALPSTPVQIAVAAGAGLRTKLLGGTYVRDFVAGAYTNVDATYGSLQLQDPNGDWLSCPVINDAAGPVADLTTFFAAMASPMLTDILAPFTFADVATGWLVFQGGTATASVDNTRVELAMDNNGSGNLTGGNPANTLKVTLYYAIEAL